MFTGLIEGVGKIRSAEPSKAGRRLWVDVPWPAAELVDGESIAVDGVCLTVAAFDTAGFAADVIEETLRRTTLGRLDSGGQVNLERSLRVGDRLGGHIVQGHVDVAAKVVAVQRDDEYRIAVGLEPSIRRFVAFKGSVALQGVSLTVASVSESAFEVALIPTTLQETNLDGLEPGDGVNVEVDLFARYLERMVAERPLQER